MKDLYIGVLLFKNGKLALISFESAEIFYSKCNNALHLPGSDNFDFDVGTHIHIRYIFELTLFSVRYHIHDDSIAR